VAAFTWRGVERAREEKRERVRNGRCILLLGEYDVVKI